MFYNALFIPFYLHTLHLPTLRMGEPERKGVERKLRSYASSFPFANFTFIAILFVQLVCGNLDTFRGYLFLAIFGQRYEQYICFMLSYSIDSITYIIICIYYTFIVYIDLFLFICVPNIMKGWKESFVARRRISL